MAKQLERRALKILGDFHAIAQKKVFCFKSKGMEGDPFLRGSNQLCYCGVKGAPHGFILANKGERRRLEETWGFRRRVIKAFPHNPIYEADFGKYTKLRGLKSQCPSEPSSSL